MIYGPLNGKMADFKYDCRNRLVSEDETTGEVAVKTVTETYVNETDELVHIGVNGETISATPSHPFYVNKFGWTLAGSLRAGDVHILS